MDSIASAHPLQAYGVLFVSALLENLLPPVPGDAVTVFGAYLVGREALGLWPVIAVTWLGSLTGFMALFGIGRLAGRAVLRGRFGNMLAAESLTKVEEWLGRWGLLVVLANRFLAGIRSVISIASGMGGMRVLPVAGCAAISILIWNALLITAGLYVGTNWELVLDLLQRYGQIVTVLLVLTGATILYLRWRKRQRDT